MLTALPGLIIVGAVVAFCVWALPTFTVDPSPPSPGVDTCIQTECVCQGDPRGSGRWQDCDCRCTAWEPYL